MVNVECMLSLRNALRNTLDRNTVRRIRLWRRPDIKRRKKTALAALAAVLSLGYGLAVACSDGEHYQQTRFQVPPTALTLPSRPLVWGDVNIIHTTDTHGWLLGHQKLPPPEPNYSGTLGDLASFVFHMKETAENKGADLLLVDTGDLHHGTGFSADGNEGLNVESNEFLARLPYDLLTIGNHEMYNNTVARYMHTNFAKKFPGRYLTSNAYITVRDAQNNSQEVPIGWQYAKFKTLKGRRVTALGVIFDAKDPDSDVTVHHAKKMTTEKWFTDLIKESADFFLLIGHMPVGRKEKENSWNLVFDPIRNLHKDTPIIVLGGHSHIRNCAQYDSKSMALQSGAFMDTVGWLSVNLTSPSGNPSFSRRYLDPNRVTYKYHTTHHEFDTYSGLKITDGLKELFEKYDLGKVWGKSPHDYLVDRDPPTSDRSVLKMFVEDALPVALSDTPSVAAYRYFVIGTGVLRYDIFQGTFDENDQLTTSPYVDKLFCIPNVPLKYAKAAAQKMNQKSSKASSSFSDSDSDYEPYHARRRDLMEVDQTRLSWLAEMNSAKSTQAAGNLTLGYVTTDECGTKGDGDDTPHTPARGFAESPSVVTSLPPMVADETLVDLVFLHVHEKKTLDALNSVQSRGYNINDILKNYTNITTNQVLGLYASKKWN